MDTAITIGTLKEAGIIIIGIGLILLIAYSVAFVKNLVITVKLTNKILEDAQVVSKITAEKSKEVDKLITDVAGSASLITESIKGNQSILSALTSLVNALAALKKLVKNG